MSKELIENVDFKIDPHPNEKDQAIVTILNEEYKNVEISYGIVSFGKENKDGTINCNFDYKVFKNPLNKDLEDSKFNDFLGDIITSMMLTKINEMVVDDNRQNRDIDIEELDDQGGLQ